MEDIKGTAEELLAKEAAAWVQRLKTATPKEQAEFARWLRESRAHVREMLLAGSWEVVLHHLGPEQHIDVAKLKAACSNVVPAAQRRAGRAAKRAPVWHWPWLAALAVSVAVTASVLWSALPFLREVLWQQYSTPIGEQRTLALADGSVVSLNARSKVRIEFSDEARDIYLSEGQALFSVAHDEARPFRVHVDGSVVQAIGTKFDVHRLADRVDVAVMEGRVQVAHERRHATNRLDKLVASTQVTAGEALSIASTGHFGAPRLVEVTEISAWRERRLVFRDRPLGEIVDEFERFNAKPRVHVEGAELRARRFNGVFDADDPEALIAYLAMDRTISLERRGDDLVIRRRPVMVQSDP